jgi:hypothetical protein
MATWNAEAFVFWDGDGNGVSCMRCPPNCRVQRFASHLGQRCEWPFENRVTGSFGTVNVNRLATDFVRRYRAREQVLSKGPLHWDNIWRTGHS